MMSQMEAAAQKNIEKLDEIQRLEIQRIFLMEILINKDYVYVHFDRCSH